MLPLFGVSILTPQTGRNKMMTEFKNGVLKPRSHRAERYKSSSYSCGDGGGNARVTNSPFVWYLQAWGFSPRCCWHAAVQHDASSPPWQTHKWLRRRTLSQQIQLAFPRRQRSAVGMTHCNMMKLYTNASDSIWALWDAAAGNHTSNVLIWGWQLVPCIQLHPPSARRLNWGSSFTPTDA